MSRAAGIPVFHGGEDVNSLVIGARTDEQLCDNLACADLVLSSDERAALDQVSTPDLIYPHWHQAQTANDRLSQADLALLAPHLKNPHLKNPHLKNPHLKKK